MYTVYFKDRGEEKFHTIPEPAPESWIHAEYATFDDLEKIANILHIDPEDIADSLDLNEIPRIERLENDVFVVFVRFPHMQEAGLYTATLSIVFAKDYLVTICPTQCHIIQKMLAEPSDLLTKMKVKILIRILLKIVYEYNKVIKKTRAEVIHQEKDISKMADAEITELTRKEEKLNQCHTSLQPLKEVIEKILSGKYTVLYERDQDLLEDLLLATEQVEEMCRLSLRILSSLRNSVQVIITNQFNKTIRLLTALTIILNFPTTISSIFGMNIPLPFEHSRLAFLFIMCIIVLVSVATFFFFQRRRWL
jgi:magnesium transporter